MLRTIAATMLGAVLFACTGAQEQRPAPTVGGFENSPAPSRGVDDPNFRQGPDADYP